MGLTAVEKGAPSHCSNPCLNMSSTVGGLNRSQRCLQVLNIAVYRLLGEKGVYYGSRLGKKVLISLILG